jgi:hypothetical protein
VASGKLGSVVVRVSSRRGYDMTSLNVYRQIDVDRGIATTIRHHICGTDEGLSLAIIKCVTLRVIEKFHPEGRVWGAIQVTLNVRVTTTSYD